jgi:tRNA pseudouridine38-40 synthase
VQGRLAAAIQHVTGEVVLPQGSGRTDAGVHALGQVASFSLEVPIPAENLHRALNRALPPNIRVLSVEEAQPGFHARHSAVHKTYEYRIFPRIARSAGGGDRICSPMLAPFVWDCPWPLSLGLLQTVAGDVMGEHDFTSFAASDPDLATRNGKSATASTSTPSRARASCTIWCETWWAPS